MYEKGQKCTNRHARGVTLALRPTPAVVALLLLLVTALLDTATGARVKRARKLDNNDLVFSYLSSIWSELASSLAAHHSLPQHIVGKCGSDSDALPRFSAMAPGRNVSVAVRRSLNNCKTDITLQLHYSSNFLAKYGETLPCETRLRTCAFLDFSRHILMTESHWLDSRSHCSYPADGSVLGSVIHEDSIVEFGTDGCNAIKVDKFVSEALAAKLDLHLTIRLQVSGIRKHSETSAVHLQEESNPNYHHLLGRYTANRTDAGLIHLSLPFNRKEAQLELARMMSHVRQFGGQEDDLPARKRRSAVDCSKSALTVSLGDFNTLTQWAVVLPRVITLPYCRGSCSPDKAKYLTANDFLNDFDSATGQEKADESRCGSTGDAVIDFTLSRLVPPMIKPLYGVAGCECLYWDPLTVIR